MLEKYRKYLDNVDASLGEFFEIQKPYICCKEGCSSCCETGEYPITDLEFQYLMIGYSKLKEEDKNIIKENVDKVKKEKKENPKDQKFMHRCPFLIDKKCSVYSYRGLICRNHGLVYYTTDKNDKLLYIVPHCVNDGLNYSSVFDDEMGTLSSKKWEETGIEVEPVSYNIGTKFLRNNHTTKALELEFGEEKAIIDWFQ